MSASRRPRSSTQPKDSLHKKIAKRNPLGRFLTAYGIRHAQAVLLSLGQITRIPWSTLMICIVLGIALALPTGLFVLLKNVQTLGKHWNQQSPIMLYLKLPATEAESMAVAKQIEARTDVEKVTYISPEVGLAEFQKQSGLSEALKNLDENPLPALLIVTPKLEAQSPAAVENLLNALKTLPQVDQAKLDLAWVKRLEMIVNLGEKLTYGLAALFGLGVILVTGSTIHLAIQSHHEEIAVYQLLGATDGFIRRPFLYRGVLYGFAGGVVTCLIIALLVGFLSQPVGDVANLYGSQFALKGLGMEGNTLILLLGAVLGWIGAVVAVYKHRTRI